MFEILRFVDGTVRAFPWQMSGGGDNKYDVLFQKGWAVDDCG